MTSSTLIIIVIIIILKTHLGRIVNLRNILTDKIREGLEPKEISYRYLAEIDNIDRLSMNPSGM